MDDMTKIHLHHREHPGALVVEIDHELSEGGPVPGFPGYVAIERVIGTHHATGVIVEDYWECYPDL